MIISSLQASRKVAAQAVIQPHWQCPRLEELPEPSTCPVLFFLTPRPGFPSLIPWRGGFRCFYPNLNFWSRCISLDLLQINCKTSTNKNFNKQISGHAALQHGTNSRPGSWHTWRFSESSRTPFRSQYRTEALCKVGSIFSVEEEIFIEKDE